MSKLNRQAPPVPETQGWVIYDAKELGFSLATPSYWRVPKLMDLSGLGSLTGEQEPPVPLREVPKLDVNEDNGSKRLLLANKSTNDVVGEYPTQIIGKVIVRQGGTSFKAEADKAKNDTLGVTSSETVELPAGKAQVIKGEHQDRGNSNFYDIVYILVDGNKVYRFHFKTSISMDTIAKDAPQVMQTFRVLN